MALMLKETEDGSYEIVNLPPKLKKRNADEGPKTNKMRKRMMRWARPPSSMKPPTRDDWDKDEPME